MYFLISQIRFSVRNSDLLISENNFWYQKIEFLISFSDIRKSALNSYLAFHNNFVKTFPEPLDYAYFIFDRCVIAILCQQTRFIVPVESAGADSPDCAGRLRIAQTSCTWRLGSWTHIFIAKLGFYRLTSVYGGPILGRLSWHRRPPYCPASTKDSFQWGANHTPLLSVVFYMYVLEKQLWEIPIFICNNFSTLTWKR